MKWPISQDYNEAVQDADNNFSDSVLNRGEVVVNAMGLPVPRSGSFADVYKFKGGDGRFWALKCFTRKVTGLRERYAKIDEHLGKNNFPFTVRFKFLEQGIRVKGEWFPLLKMEWVEGIALNDFVGENVNKPQALHGLMQLWAKLAGRLRDGNMAHADLQHGNVLLVPGATPLKVGLKLIDYDGMWVPALSDYHSGEIGHPNYQHPLRLKDKLYNGDVDRFAHLVVATALRATVIGGRAVWDRYDNGDNLLFKESDLRDPASARIFKALWELNDPVLCVLVGHLALSSKEPMRKTPWLDDVLFEEGGPRLTADQEKRVREMLGVSSISARPAGSPTGAKPQEQFSDFRFGDDDKPSKAVQGGTRSVATQSGTRPAATKRSGTQAKAKGTSKAAPEKSSKLPLIIGGAVAAVVLLVGGIVAGISLSGNKDQSTQLAQNKDNDKSKNSQTTSNTGKGPSTATTPAVVRPTDVPNATNPARTGTIGVAAVKGSSNFVFIRQNDPVIYMSVDGSARKAREIGRHNRPVRTIAVAEDGSRLISGDESGEVRALTLVPGSGTVRNPDARPMTEQLHPTIKIENFNRLYEFTVYVEGVVIRDTEAGIEERVYAGSDVVEKDGPFKMMMEGAKSRWQEPLSKATELFDGTVVVQVFRSGVMINQKGTPRNSSVSLGPNKKIGVNVPKPMGAASLRTVIGGLKLFDAEFEYMLYREGVLLRDKSGKEAIVLAGKEISDLTGPFQKQIENGGPYARPVSPATDVFEGALTVQLFRHGLIISPKGRNERAYLFNAGADITIGEPVPAKQESKPTLPSMTSLKEHTSSVIACCISFDGYRAVTVEADRKLCEWDLKEGRLVQKFEVPQTHSVAFLGSPSLVMLGTEKESVTIWNLPSHSQLRTFAGHSVPVKAVCVSRNLGAGWTAGDDGTVHFWNLATMSRHSTLSGKRASVVALSVSPGGQYLACLDSTGRLEFFDAKTGKSESTYSDKITGIGVSFISDSELVTTGDPEPLRIKVPRPE